MCAAGAGALYSADSFLKETILPILQDQFVQGQVLLKNLKRTSEYVQAGGSTTKWAVRTSGNDAVGAFASGGELMSAGKQRGTQAYTPLLNAHGRMQIEHKLIKLANSDKNSFRVALKDEMERLTMDFKRDQNRQAIGDGKGILGTVSSTDGTSVVTLDSTASPRWNPLTRYFNVGDRVDILTSARANRLIACTISAVDEAAGTITLSGTGTFANIIATDIIVKQKSTTTTLIEMTGCRAIINTGAAAATFNNLFNVATATYPTWKSKVFDTEEDPDEEAIDKMRIVGAKAGSAFKFALTTWEVQSKYATLQMEKKKFVNTTKIYGGYDGQKDEEDAFSGPDIAGIGPMLADSDMPEGTDANTGELFLIDPSVLLFQEAGKPTWMDDDGSVLHQVQDYAEFSATFVWYRELITKQRNRLVRHINLKGNY